MIRAWRFHEEGTVFFEDDEIPGVWVAMDGDNSGTLHFDTGVYVVSILDEGTWIEFEFFIQTVTHYAHTGYYPYKIELREPSAS